MSAPVLSSTSLRDAPASTAAAWQRRLPLLLGLGVLLLGALFNQEAIAAVQTWSTSTAYNHCFMVIPITLYLLWDRRFDIVGVQPRPMPVAMLLGLPLAAAWLIAERLGIMEGRQLIAVSFLQLLFLAVLGKRLWWAMSGPLLYLYFLVPFGEFLTPRLQDFTTWFIRHGLDLLAIPAYIDGHTIEIPQGAFFVAEACAGLRFLIASIAFGCLYALLMYRSPLRRSIFMLVSIIVPIVANGFRGLGIVYLGYLLGSAQAAAADHIIYGWIFFSAVILLLIMLGLPFRQDDVFSHPALLPDRSRLTPFPMSAALGATLGVIIIAAVSPALAAGLALATEHKPPDVTTIDMGPGCVVQSAVTTPASPHVHGQHAICNGTAMDITWEAFSPRITAATLMAERGRLVARAQAEDLSENWLEADDGPPSPWRIMHAGDPPFVIAVAVWVEGTPVRPDLRMRATMAMNSLFGSAYAPMVVTLSPSVDWAKLTARERRNADASVSAFILVHPELTAAIGTSSAL